MDQTEQIIEALKDAGTTAEQVLRDAGAKAEQVLADVVPVLIADTRAMGMAYVIAGVIALVVCGVLCVRVARAYGMAMAGASDADEDRINSAHIPAMVFSGLGALGGAIVILVNLKALMAPTLYLVEKLF